VSAGVYDGSIGLGFGRDEDGAGRDNLKEGSGFLSCRI